ncbi:MAG TPA: hypothetical protein VJ775_07055 [Sphingomicrobium sp.]|nr:hypothetical protein [Sphingomicrobium sp.]
MLVLAVLAAATAPPQQVRASVRIVRAQRVNKEEWQHSARKREIVVREGERKVIVRLIEFE